MNKVSRRSVLALGIAAVAAPLVTTVKAAAEGNERYGPEEGAELLPGIRQVDLGEQPSVIPGYETISMRDIVLDPGAELPEGPMENNMVCHMLEGELLVVQDGVEFTASENTVWSCTIGTMEALTNTTDSVAIMRVIDLLTA